MKITKLYVNLANEGNLVAYVSMAFDDALIIRGMRVVKRPDETMLLVMPSRMAKSGQYKDIAHPLCAEFRTYLEKSVFNEIARILSGNQGTQGTSAQQKPSSVA